MSIHQQIWKILEDIIFDFFSSSYWVFSKLQFLTLKNYQNIFRTHDASLWEKLTVCVPALTNCAYIGLVNKNDFLLLENVLFFLRSREGVFEFPATLSEPISQLEWQLTPKCYSKVNHLRCIYTWDFEFWCVKYEQIKPLKYLWCNKVHFYREKRKIGLINDRWSWI